MFRAMPSTMANLRAISLSVAMLAYLMAGLTAVGGLVLCVGTGGHIALERLPHPASSTHGAAVPCPEATRSAASELGAHEFACADLPLVSAAAFLTIEKEQSPTAPDEGGGSFALPQELARSGRALTSSPAVPRAPPEIDPVLRAQRSTILLI